MHWRKLSRRKHETELFDVLEDTFCGPGRKKGERLHDCALRVQSNVRELAKQEVRLPHQVQGFLLLRRANLSTQARIAIMTLAGNSLSFGDVRTACKRSADELLRDPEEPDGVPFGVRRGEAANFFLGLFGPARRRCLTACFFSSRPWKARSIAAYESVFRFFCLSGPARRQCLTDCFFHGVMTIALLSVDHVTPGICSMTFPECVIVIVIFQSSHLSSVLMQPSTPTLLPSVHSSDPGWN